MLHAGFSLRPVLARLSPIAIDWHGYGESYREYRSLAAMIPPRHHRHQGGSAFYHETDAPRSEMYGPLLIVQYDQVGPLFGQKNQHPLLWSGPLKAAVDPLNLSFLPIRSWITKVI